MREKLCTRSVFTVAALSLALLVAGFAAKARSPQTLKAPENPTPYYVVTFVDFTPDSKDMGVATLKQYAVDLRKEPGMQRVEVLSQLNRVNHFIIYEVWQNEESFRKHEGSQVSKDFRAKVQPWLGAPFDERAHFKVE